jgi:hypothetical protein
MTIETGDDLPVRLRFERDVVANPGRKSGRRHSWSSSPPFFSGGAQAGILLRFFFNNRNGARKVQNILSPFHLLEKLTVNTCGVLDSLRTREISTVDSTERKVA